MISIKQAYVFALDIFKKRWKLFLALCVVLFATSALSRIGEGFASVVYNPIALALISLFFLVLYIILNAVFSAGVKNILPSLVHGRIARFDDIVASKKDAWKYFLGQLIVLAFVLVSVMLGALIVSLSSLVTTSAILPALLVVVLAGLFLWVFSLFGFWAYAMFDKNSTPRQGFSHSKKITRGHELKIIAFYFLSVGVALVAVLVVSLIPIPVVPFVLALIVGYISVSLFFISSVHIYHQLDTHHKASAHVTKKEEHVTVRPEELEAPEPKSI
jgi:hypothetical protein